MARSHQDLEHDVTTAVTAGKMTARRAVDELLLLETELAASGVSQREANRRVVARRKALRSDFKRSEAWSYWYDEHDFDNDCWGVWDSAGAEERVTQLQSLSASHSGRS